jgi:hypothetical protein
MDVPTVARQPNGFRRRSLKRGHVLLTTVYFLHVLFGFAAAAFLVVPGWTLEMIAHTRDVPFIRRSYRMGKIHGQVGGPLAFLTAIFGLITAWRYGFSLTSGWLIAAYIAFALVIALGIGYHTRRVNRIDALAQASPDAAPSPELVAAIDDPLSTPANWTSALLWIFLIWLMVAKPF